MHKEILTKWNILDLDPMIMIYPMPTIMPVIQVTISQVY
jgi:hypothetical protein